MAVTDSIFLKDNFAKALKNGHIRAFFQPIYRAMTGEVMCTEALARWIDPDIGLISPDKFIPVLEQCDLITDLDMEILRQTCEFYSELRDLGHPLHCFSVNLSRQDFRHKELYDRIVSILNGYDVPYDAIKIEITESLMLENTDIFRGTLEKLNNIGFSIWMDDFGSGYSSLNVLKNYNFDLMKFDMLFLRDFSAKGQKLFASMINMAKSLGIKTLAEGVELEEHRHFLQSAGCESLQGFFFSKPVSKDDFISMIKSGSIRLESVEDRDYWSEIGRLNLLSAYPLNDYSDTDNISKGKDVSIALLECSDNKVSYVYTSESFIKCIRQLGYTSIAEIEEVFNDHRSDQYLLMKKLIDDAISIGSIQKTQYVNNSVYYKLNMKCLSRKQDSAMLAMTLTTFDSEQEVNTAKEMLYYSNSLFSTYDVVVLMYPESSIANRLYTSNNLPAYDKERSLQMSIEKFTKAEVHPDDQKRYLRFLDSKTMIQRIEENPKGFIQGFFRMRWRSDNKVWHIVRLSKVPAKFEKTYILTIQMMGEKGCDALDILVEDHPELFT